MRGHVFPDEGHAQQLARHGGLVSALQHDVVEQTEGHAVDLGEHVREHRVRPVVREVEQLHAIVFAALPHCA